MQLKPLAALLLTSVVGLAVAAPAKPAAPAAASAVAPAAFNLDPAAIGKTGAGAPPANTAPATAPVLAATPTAIVATPTAAAQPMPVLEEGAVNPFTGEALSAERRKREADRLRAENQVLEERIKQVGLLNDLNHAPVKKRVEMEIYLENTRPKVSATPPVKAPIGSATVESSAPAKEKTPKKGAPTKVASGKGIPAVLSPQKPAVDSTGDLVKPKVMQTPPPEVVGVIRTKDGSTAILSNNGKTILARPGEASSVGVITAVSEKQVQLGSQTLDYNQTSVARIQRTDKEPKQENTASQALPVSTRSTITLPPIPGTGSSPSLPPSVRPGNPSVAPTAPAAP